GLSRQIPTVQAPQTLGIGEHEYPIQFSYKKSLRPFVGEIRGHRVLGCSTSVQPSVLHLLTFSLDRSNPDRSSEPFHGIRFLILPLQYWLRYSPRKRSVLSRR
ncbi:unnamed protein product, partial [Sphacelaria rigidula]